MADEKRLEAERQAQATHLRVERVAREKLAMRMATPDVTRYVTDARAPAASGVDAMSQEAAPRCPCRRVGAGRQLFHQPAAGRPRPRPGAADSW